MRTAAALLLLFAGGCFYDAPNPWDTRSDMNRWQEMKEHCWELEMTPYWDPPQKSPARLVDPDLEAWRDTVLIRADGETLGRIRVWSLRKLTELEKRRADLLQFDELNRRDALRVVEDEIRIERLRLRLLDDRLAGRTAE